VIGSLGRGLPRLATRFPGLTTRFPGLTRGLPGIRPPSTPALRGPGTIPRGPATRGLCSFDADTRILMADGTTKPISDIRPGDRVLATDPVTGEHGPRQVTHTWAHNDVLVDLQLADGQTVTTTEDHPFWNHTDQQRQPAETLDAGDQLLTPTGTTVTTAGLDPTSAHTGPANNLTVDGTHTYYVIAGDQPVLVHNPPPGNCRITSSPASPQVPSQTVWTSRDLGIRVDVENPVPGAPGAANVHVQFTGRGADPTKYYFDPNTGTWVSETGAVLSPRVAQQIPPSAIVKAFQYLGIP